MVQDLAANAISPVAWVFIGIGVLTAAAFGTWRAKVSRVWLAQGVPWRQGTWLTLALWVGTVVVRLVLAAVERGVDQSAGHIGMASLLLSLAITLGVQRIVETRRGAALLTASSERDPAVARA